MGDFPSWFQEIHKNSDHSRLVSVYDLAFLAPEGHEQTYEIRIQCY